MHQIARPALLHASDNHPMTPFWNPSGYLRNAIETVRVTAASGKF
jgi:sulfite dehydrogenase